MYKVAYNACFGGFSLSEEASEYLRDKFGIEINPKFGFIYDLERHDVRLIETIERFGDDASGHCSDIKIETISSPIYRIDDYDGNETVKTPDLIDWSVIKECDNV